MLGYDKTELVGRNLLELVHPDDHGLIDRIHGAMRRGLIDSDQTRRLYVKKDGDVLHAMAGVTAVRDASGKLIGIIKQIQDISRRVRAEHELQESLARQRVVIDSLADGLLVFDADGRIRVSNPSAEEILGVSASALRAKLSAPLVELLDEDGTPVPRDGYIHQDVLRSGKPKRGVIYRVERPDGQTRWVRANAQPLVRPGGEEPFVVVSFADVTGLKLREAELVHHALHDPLTDLPNRRHFMDLLGELVSERGEASAERGAVLYLDLDGFKRVNDRYGHGAGDRVLVEVATRLASAMPADGTLARLAGDEFGALLVGGSVEQAVTLGRQLMDAMAEPFEVDGVVTGVGVSVGVTMVHGNDDDPQAVLGRADTSLRRAKEEGRGRLVEFSPEVDRAVQRLVALERDLAHARERGELTLDYTPIVALAGGEAVAEKAELRWRHPRFGEVPASEVRRLARETGLAAELQRWVIGEALASVSERAPAGRHARLVLSVVPEMLLEPGVAGLRELLGASGVAPERVILAVHAADDAEDDRLAGSLTAVEELGVDLMLESSGEGRTQARRAGEFPYHWLGVHPAGIERLLPEPANRAMLHGVLDSLRREGVRTVAETDGRGAVDVDTLRSLGFDYLLGEPSEVGQSGGSSQTLVASR